MFEVPKKWLSRFNAPRTAPEASPVPCEIVPPRRKSKGGGRPRTKINVQAVWERMQRGESLRRISRTLGLDHHTVWDQLRKAGLPTKVGGKQSQQAISTLSAAVAPEASSLLQDHSSLHSAPSGSLAPAPPVTPTSSLPLPETPTPYFATLNQGGDGLHLIPPGTKWIFLVCGKWNQQCTASYQPYCTAVSIDQWRDGYEDLRIFRDAERIFVIVSFDRDNQEIALPKQPEVYGRWLDSIARAPRAIFEKCVVSKGISGEGAVRDIAKHVFLQAMRTHALDWIVDSIVTTYHFEPLPHWRDVEKLKELSAAPVTEHLGYSWFGRTIEPWITGSSGAVGSIPVHLNRPVQINGPEADDDLWKKF